MTFSEKPNSNNQIRYFIADGKDGIENTPTVISYDDRSNFVMNGCVEYYNYTSTKTANLISNTI